jgi:carbon storage regulator
MLVLTRCAGEKVVVDSAIRATVAAVQGGKVRLGVTAPASVRTNRAEVHERSRGSRSGCPAPSGASAPAYPKGETDANRAAG